VEGMDEIIEEFLVESHENLDRLDGEFVRLESTPDDVDLLASIFRDIHTIKGTSGFLGYTKLESVAHVGENLLSKLRDRELRLTAARTSALLAMVDAIREILTAIEAGGEEGDGDYTALVRRLEAMATGAGDEEVTAQAAAEDALPMGELLQQIAGVSAADVEAAVAEQEAGDPRHLGEILLDQGVVDSQQVVEALQHQRPAGKGAVVDSSIRVDVDLLDRLMNLVGELVLARNQILQFTGESGSTQLIDTSQRLNLITTELQEGVMKTRMQPIGNVFSKFPRVVRDLALQLGKEVAIEMDGRETELDKTIIEAIKDPLTHMVRNSVDHGIEPPDVRVARGKPAEGRLHLRAYHEGGQVIIEIQDDGGGIDAHKVAAKAVEKGLVSADKVARMSPRELTNLVFLPGFSTAEKVSNVSGRGVGMDVVRTSIERIGGSVDLTSQPGLGTATKIKIPLTLAIIPALIVTSGEDRFAIPQVSLLELVRLEAEEARTAVEHIQGAPVYRLRGTLLPLVHLDQQLGISPDDGTTAGEAVNIVVLQADDQQFGLVVRSISDTAEIVVKPLGHVLGSIPVYAGATIMGDGKVALILDVLGIAAQAGILSSHHPTASLADGAAGEAASTESLLVFQLGEEVGEGRAAAARRSRRMAVRLEQVARLEEIDRGRLEYASGRPVVQYRDEILPLVWLGESLGVPPVDSDRPLQVIVYEQGERRVGMVVDRISDVVEEALELQRPSGAHGVLGSAVIGGRVTDLLDVDAIIRAECPDLLATAGSAA
jgi:two-component system, chemotaxis family, sensor kinase CheA